MTSMISSTYEVGNVVVLGARRGNPRALLETLGRSQQKVELDPRDLIMAVLEKEGAIRPCALIEVVGLSKTTAWRHLRT